MPGQKTEKHGPRRISAEQKAAAALDILAGVRSTESVAAQYQCPERDVAEWVALYLSAARRDREAMSLLDSADRSRRRRKAIAITAACFGLLLLGGIALAADGSCTGSKMPFCFFANTPAKASEINHNFDQLAEWIEQKVGTVGEKNVSVSGDLSVAGDVSGLTVTWGQCDWYIDTDWVDTDPYDCEDQGNGLIYLDRMNNLECPENRVLVDWDVDNCTPPGDSKYQMKFRCCTLTVRGVDSVDAGI